jgi:hypothetical protein
MKPPEDPLDSLLNQWDSTPALASTEDLTRAVWRRIGLEESTVAGGGVWDRFAAWLLRPAATWAFVGACAMAGLFLAELRVARVQQTHNAQLARSYLRLIDPLLNEPTGKDTR